MAVMLFALTILGNAKTAYSCTCGELTVTQQRENATAVFLGTVIKKSRSNAVQRDGVEVTFEVRRIWKGDLRRKTLVYTGASLDLYPFENLCAPRFEPGKQYLVFALGTDKLETDICAGTLASSYAKAVIAELGRGKSLKPKTIRSRSMARNNSNVQHRVMIGKAGHTTQRILTAPSNPRATAAAAARAAKS